MVPKMFEPLKFDCNNFIDSHDVSSEVSLYQTANQWHSYNFLVRYLLLFLCQILQSFVKQYRSISHLIINSLYGPRQAKKYG